MKGVILAGGLGTRMGIVSRSVNKHMCLVYKYPMILYAVADMTKCDIEDVLIVTSERTAGQMILLMGNGEDFNVNITYKYQREPLGIANALLLAKDFAECSPILVTLADNFCDPPPTDIVSTWDRTGAKIIINPVPNPEEFGVVATDVIYKVLEDGRVAWGAPNSIQSYTSPSIDEFIDEHPINRIIEKPNTYYGNLMIAGIYMYDSDVFDIIEGLTPSPRGEYEITDVNAKYLEMGALQYGIYNGMWIDCGNPDKLLDASIYARDHRAEPFT